jgi:uncharacterized protein
MSLPSAIVPADRRHIAIVLHDVAPATWSSSLRALMQIQLAGRHAGVMLPVTLLVVPALHGTPPTAPFVRWLRVLVGQGHEIALHGLTHGDDEPHRRSALARAWQRWSGEADSEFGDLAREEATHRIGAARRWASTCRLPAPGFVAPDWLMSRGAWDAVGSAGFDYTCTRDTVVALPDRESIPAPGIVFDPAAPSRRFAVWENRLREALQHRAPLWRLELHPGDVDDDIVCGCWTAMLARALRHRVPVRLSEVALRARAATRRHTAGRAVQDGAGGSPDVSAAYSLRRL